jgi:uncharacterized protein with FMN-binding domain
MINPPSCLSQITRAAKKFFVSACVVLAYTAFVIQQHYADPAVSDTAVAVVTVPATAETARATVTPRPTATKAPNGLYQDGEYTGRIANAYWGEVQVKVVIQNGSLSDVQFLDYPHDRRTSVRINNVAVPYLRTEAIQAQTAKVHIVTGATLTSQAFIESLASALKAAQ